MTNPQLLVEQGMTALNNGRAAEARTIFEGLIQQGVANASIWLGLAYACRDLGDLEALQKAADSSIAIEPRNPRAYILKAQAFDKDGDPRAASAFYLKGLNNAPPPDRAPADLRPELVMAHERYQALIKSFERSLLSGIEGELAKAGAAGRRVADSVDFLLGRKQPYFQQPKNYFFPELSHIEFFDHSAFDWVDELEAQTDDIRAELQNVIADNSHFRPYITANAARPESDPHGLVDNDGWTAFFLWRDGVLQEDNAKLCPNTVSALSKTPLPMTEGRAPNVLFSRLRPGANIPPHNGLINTRLICHLPLIVPDGCGFRVGNDTREWVEGKFWAFDDTIEHEAWNKGTEDRYILLFEIWRPEITEIERDLIGKILMSIDAYDGAKN